MSLRNTRNGKEFGAEMNESLQKFKQIVEVQLPDHIRDEAQKIVDNSFAKEQFQDGKSSKWEGRANDKESSKPRTKRRALLVNEGKLISATEAEVRNKDTVAIAVNDPEASIYAPVHNEGLKAGRGKGFKMKQRQFMPVPGEPFPELEDKVGKYLDEQMDKILGQ